jgi:hypothetical protein
VRQLSRVYFLYMVFGLVIGIIEHFKHVTTKNVGTVTNRRTLQFTIAHINPSQSAVSSLVVAGTDPNSVPFC